MSGSTNRPSDDLERLAALAATGVVEPEPTPPGPSSSATGPFSMGTEWTRLIDSLAGDIILSHVPGRRVLDLGYGSPEVAEWVAERVGKHFFSVEKTALEQGPARIAETSGFLPASNLMDEQGNFVLPTTGETSLHLPGYADAIFDVVYSLRTVPHLGYDTESSERLTVELLREAARVLVDGGTMLVQIANPRSLRGILVGIRNPITVVSRRRMIVGDRFGLTRWDTLGRFLRFLPPELEFVRVHGLGVLIPHESTLHIPLVGSLLERLRVLDLSNSWLGEATGAFLLEHAERFEHLDTLDLAACHLPAAMIATLRARFGARVRLGGQVRGLEWSPRVHRFLEQDEDEDEDEVDEAE
ncbi:MAG: hypothetical protein HC927_05260 [Deltaproteobacteria bacterium]|nr:hypothetical protein [Deltaproteobacteria bacterium]